ncbi:heterokaryon incompatibility protein-domain-containing protein [Fusarium flagelliforme]|uniref:heterokaryon incompatibility protein-domain-containing protein n=1 Tax=Fusarium flagelliforme TaxID=2675880 RepID=UPI001E8DA305|nr:heterokaryon incompatibility protein-domain-containing protein [Fusarium flagelliforme]KAH7173783.1 heterokaryon incompatibility protein-domain-containing protein [Fusarium flagelliforme]
MSGSMSVSNRTRVAKLCKGCEVLEISQQALYSSSPAGNVTEWELDLDRKFSGTWPLLRDDLERMKESCDLCSHIYSLLYCWWLAVELDNMHTQDIHLSMFYLVQRTTNDRFKLQCLRVRVDAKGNKEFTLDCPITGVGSIPPSTTIDLAEPFTHLAPKSRGWIHTEIETCVRHHNHAHPQKGFVPDRLIKVDEVEPRLVITSDDPEFLLSDQQPKYAALTYCWGPSPHSDQQLKTTRRNIGDHLQVIPQDRLPQVAKDAITVTRELGISYLWIDALCILQDFGSDWNHQCTKMDNIYSNAHMTICSASSANCEEGFILKMDKTPAIRIHPLEPDGKSIFFTIYLPFFHYIATEDLYEAEWYERGWTFQERMGSSRIVTFGKQNLHFACQSVGHSMGFQREDLGRGFKMIYRDLLTDGDISLVYEAWDNDVAAEFSRFDMAFAHPTDILPSFAGIASLFHYRLKDTYLAGLWKGDLHRGLLWTTYRRFQEVSFKDLLIQLELPSPYVAPSWSWVAKSWVLSGRLNAVYFLPLLSEYIDNIRSEVEITEAKVVLKGSNPFGEIINAYLDIRGRILSPKEELKYVQVGDDELHPRQTLHLGDQYLADIEPDFVVKESLSCTGSLNVPISLLLVGNTLKRPEYRRETHTELKKQKRRKADNLQAPLGNGNKDGQPLGERLAYGLLIYPAKRPGEYYRVGTFMSEFEGTGRLAFFKKCEMRTLRLV